MDGGLDGAAEKIELPKNGNISLATFKRLRPFERAAPLPTPGEPGGTPVKTMKMQTRMVPTTKKVPPPSNKKKRGN